MKQWKRNARGALRILQDIGVLVDYDREPTQGMRVWQKPCFLTVGRCCFTENGTVYSERMYMFYDARCDSWLMELLDEPYQAEQTKRFLSAILRVLSSSTHCLSAETGLARLVASFASVDVQAKRSCWTFHK